MSKTKWKMIRLGLFVITAVVLFAFGLYNIGSKKNLFGSNIRVIVEFRDIKGLLPGNNVRYSGMTVGSIESIRIVNDTLLRVFMNIKEGQKEHIKKNSIASINSNGLVGDMVINIFPQSGMSSPIETGDVLQTQETIEMQAMLSTLDQTNRNILHISENLLVLTEKLNDEKSILTQLTQDEKLPSSITHSVKNIESLTQNLSKVSEEIISVIDDIQDGKGAVGYLLNDADFSRKTTELLDNLDRQFITNTTPILSNLESTSKSVNSLATKMDSTFTEIDFNEGVLGLLLKDSSATQKTQQLLDSLQISTNLFNENMEALQHNFLFRKYFKKKRKREEKLGIN